MRESLHSVSQPLGPSTHSKHTENLVPLANMEGPQGVRRIENVINWNRVVSRYRIMHRKEVQPGENDNAEQDGDMPSDSVEDLHDDALLNGTSTQPTAA